MTATVQAFFHEPTFTVTYLVSDPVTRTAAVIDPVLDFDPKSGRTGTQSAAAVLDAAKRADLTVRWILETHAHADHLSAAPFLKTATGAQTVIGANIEAVQAKFTQVFDLSDVAPQGRDFDRLVREGDSLELGALSIEAIETPGHTPADVSYKIGDTIFVGDTLFMPDYGTARCDFPGGDAATLYRSIRKLLAYPPETRLFLCHDYKAPGRDHFVWETTVAAQRSANVHIKDGVGEADFVAMRTARDKTLQMPVLLLPSVQVNIRAGKLPEPAANGVRYLKLPVDAL